MKKILGIGNALVDIMIMLEDDIFLEKHDLPRGSMQLVDRSRSAEIEAATGHLNRKMASGGSAANTIYGLARLGLETGYIGSAGRDDNGNFFVRELEDAGVHTIMMRRGSDTGTALTLVSPDSERTFATHLGAAVELTASDLNPDFFDGYDILYMEGYQIANRDLVHRACRIAKEKRMKVALDLSSYNVVEAYLDDFREITGEYVDILFANEEEARSFTGLEPEKALESVPQSCDVVIIKEGSKGSLIRHGDRSLRVKAVDADVRDTTGAGDLYASGFLYGYALGRKPETCGYYGSFLAAKVIEIPGARIDNARWDTITGIISRMSY